MVEWSTKAKAIAKGHGLGAEGVQVTIDKSMEPSPITQVIEIATERSRTRASDRHESMEADTNGASWSADRPNADVTRQGQPKTKQHEETMGTPSATASDSSSRGIEGIEEAESCAWRGPAMEIKAQQ